LRDLVVKTSSSDLLNVDLIGVLQNLDLFSGNFTENSNGKTGSREGVSADQMGGNVEETTESSDFV
jgi:hypothetical protein